MAADERVTTRRLLHESAPVEIVVQACNLPAEPGDRLSATVELWDDGAGGPAALVQLVIGDSGRGLAVTVPVAVLVELAPPPVRMMLKASGMLR